MRRKKREGVRRERDKEMSEKGGYTPPDVSQLPVEAKIKAQKESCCFLDLSEKQRME